MTGGTRIVAIGSGAEKAAQPEEQIIAATAATAEADKDSHTASIAADDDWYEEPAPRTSRGLIFPAVALAAIAGWSGFFGWAHQWFQGGATPQQAITLVTSWAVPVLLVSVLWLLSMRSSRREAMRFGDTARLLSDESAKLETRLIIVNRELSLAREFLASQSRDLDSLGRVATEKLSHHADRLQGLVRDNGAQVEAIASVSTTALENMEKLRGNLPVIASSAKDVANNIASAGRTAHSQLGDMVDGFNRLNDFGQASEKHVESLRGKLEEAIGLLGTKLDEIRSQSEEHFAELEARSDEFRNRLESDEVESLAAIRARSAAMMEDLASTRSLFDGHEAESLTSLRARLGALRDESAVLARSLRDGENAGLESFAQARQRMEDGVRETLGKLEELDLQVIEASRARIAALSDEASSFDARLIERNRLFTVEMAQRTQQAANQHDVELERINGLLASIDAALADRHNRLEADSARLVGHSEIIATRIEQASITVRAIASFTRETEDGLTNSLTRLSDHLDGSRAVLSGTDGEIAKLTDDSVRLLELLQASSQLSREQLPEALAVGDEKLAELENRIGEVQASVVRAAERSEALAASVEATRVAIGQSLGEIGALQTGLEHGAVRHGNALDDLRSTLVTLDRDSSRLAEYSRDELSGALEKLTSATRQAVSTLEESGTKTIAALADKLGEESAVAIERVLRVRTAEAVGQLEEAAGHAAGISREAAINLRDQLAKISELTDNLERRVAHTRERAEEQIDNDFSRRVALITESLNSNGIDIAKALSSDVTDTAWAAYLRGDRGVFTRRAVRLLETSEARSVAQIYGEDGEFREHVSRYIHDFEGMLRQMLSTRDGHALSVTLLSSDMGKLYVSLAQAIERLRD